jgi:uncharacterized membrane protein YedE/YeeE
MIYVVAPTNQERMNNPEQQKYWNPYVAGIALGAVLLLCFVITGHGLGASGAFTALIASGVNTISPAHTNSFWREYLNGSPQGPMGDWYVIEVLGMLVGGFLSAKLAGRVKNTIEKGEHISATRRLLFAFLGGGLVGIGSKLARGCTSGQGLTGGALLSVGAWIFLISVFMSAYAIAYCMRKLWT